MPKSVAASATWTKSRIGDSFDVELGKMLSREAQQGRDKRPYLANRNVQWNRLVFDELGYMSFSAAERVKYSLQEGDILVCEGGEIGRTAIWNAELPECYIQNAIHRLRVKSGTVHPRFLLHYMKFAAGRGIFGRVSGQTSIAHLTKEALVDIEVPHPISLEEQQRLSEILDAVDERIGATSYALGKRDSLNCALADSLIPVTPDPQQLGVGWNLVPLSAVVPSVDYGISSPLTLDGGTPTLRMNNLAGGRVRLAELKFAIATIPDELILRNRDVLFNRTNSFEHVGRTAIWRGELEQATFASYLVRLNPDIRRLLPEYLVLWLNQPAIQQRIRRVATPGVHQVNVNPTSLRRLPIELPADISRQRDIAEVLEECDQTTDRMRGELTHLRLLKQGLMDDLLTGRVRVTGGGMEHVGTG